MKRRVFKSKFERRLYRLYLYLDDYFNPLGDDRVNVSAITPKLFSVCSMLWATSLSELTKPGKEDL